MRFSIFKKAEELKDKVIEDGEAFNKAYFTFEEIENPPLITLALEKGKYTFIESCTCTHCSTHLAVAELKGKLNLCSYKIAVLKAIPILKYKSEFV